MRIVLTIVFLFSFYVLSAQDNVLSVRMGIGTFSMRDQKILQSDLQFNSGLPLRVVDEFPAYYVFGGSFVVKTTSLSAMGVFVDYMSTGGRLHYEDYSGSALIDQSLHCYQVGATMQRQVTGSQHWQLMITGHVSAFFNRETLKSVLTLGTESETEVFHFRSANLGFRPGLMLQRKIGALALQSSLGYELNFTGALETREGFTLQDDNGDRITAQWGGVRVALGAGIIIGSRKKSGTD